MNDLKIPQHIALIPDGNRRWAKARGRPPWEGHWAAEKVIQDFLDWCMEIGTHQVSIWIGSTENLTKRPKREVEELYKLYMNLLEKWGQKKSVLDKYEIKVRFIGDLGRLPFPMRKLMGKIMEKTVNYQKKLLNVLVNYGGKFELMETFKKLAAQVIKAGRIEIKEKDIEDNLMVNAPLDLIVRTGGYSRLSNFMMWQASYAEIYVTKTLLPDFTKREFMKAIRWYDSVTRNFGA